MSLGQSEVAAQASPVWSGLFWEQDGFGYLSVAYGDQRQHQPPAGWVLVNSIFDEDAEVFIYRQIVGECYGCADHGGCVTYRV